ncbi:putative methionine--tRNA ligase [Prunus yedoensis var. nudiflora]|uniref:Putative methionine--tRNA ligase n=1 Tax=Prunus yedoensis var. nudiflora TaxID=2094558 RepID=A0A314UF94_PRUYE|nr:putative methionine--tRNA ligase [Prunus yedoensis var. nudiflora]
MFFNELKDEEVEFLRKEFAGIQADRKEREEAEAVKVAAQLKKTEAMAWMIIGLLSFYFNCTVSPSKLGLH